jgi:Undecaprenyl-phosphate galactose phosphotransferase WbaP
MLGALESESNEMTPKNTLLDSSNLNFPTIRLPHSTLALVLSDTAALLVSVSIGLGIKAIFRGPIDLASYLQLWPFLFVFLITYMASGLYSGAGIGAPAELRRATLCSTILFLILAVSTMSLRGAQHPVTWTLFIALFLSIVIVPLFRELVRQLCSRASWWGVPAVVFGAGSAGKHVVHALLNDPGLGLKPVAVLDDTESCTDILGVPVLCTAGLAPLLFEGQRPAYAVFAMPDVPQSRLMETIDRYGRNFSHILVVPELNGFSSLWVDSKNVGGMVGLELRQQVLLPDYALIKGFVDVVLTVIGGIFLLPLLLVIICWIKLDSRGPVFYSQERIGRHGRRFRAWKFRSMVLEADGMLETYLQQHPELLEEWERDHKLKRDPRVTRAGRFLRRTSLDELPQLWNVLRGEMSLVGPRPITDKEVEKYGSAFEIYKKVNGGITGLWQVSGRNDVSYEERVNYDQFYVRNWSVWLDCCILFRTIAVVLLSKGAY